MKKTLWLLVAIPLVSLVLWAAYKAGGDSARTAVSAPINPAEDPAPPAPRKKPLLGQPAQVTSVTPLNPAEQQAALDEGELISDLFDAATEGTPEKTEAVYAALSHPNDAVREGALDAIIQHMGRESIPRLRAALAAARTPEEKTRLTEAIEFIELPTLSEIRGASDAPRPRREQVTGQKPARPDSPPLVRKKNPPLQQE
ncbi:hypothetical protein WJU23_16575 [Prosthecobacter sp. SYSU 5D2]|uniref:hypothetical protein n=1 Tax=Prosthecobacter sp. SYSU 5D2 TaxID=3134134 RepID=UPI0031FE86DE